MTAETDMLAYLDTYSPLGDPWRRFPAPRHEQSIKTLKPVGEAPIDPREPLSFKKIARAVAITYRIPMKDLLGRSRFIEYCVPRHVFFWCCREWLKDSRGKLPVSYPCIAAFIRFDYSSVHHGVRKIVENMNKHEAAIENIEALLFPGREGVPFR